MVITFVVRMVIGVFMPALLVTPEMMTQISMSEIGFILQRREIIKLNIMSLLPSITNHLEFQLTDNKILLVYIAFGSHLIHAFLYSSYFRY